MLKRELIPVRHAAPAHAELVVVAHPRFSRFAVIKNVFVVRTWQPGEQRARE
jgi:hypothetical protein